MANNKAPAKAAGKIKCVVLHDCGVGRHDDIIELDAAEASDAQAAGYVDANPAAVAAVEG